MKKVPLLNTLLKLLEDEAVILYLFSLIGAIVVAVYGDDLGGFQNDIFNVIVGFGLLAFGFERGKQILAQNAEVIGSMVGRAMDGFEKMTGVEIPDTLEIEVRGVVVRYMKSLAPAEDPEPLEAG